jgi:hypothetical protein
MAGFDPDAEHAHARTHVPKPKTAPPKPKPAIESTATSCSTDRASSTGYSDEEKKHREGLIQSLHDLRAFFATHFEHGKDQAQRRIAKQDVPAHSQIWSILNTAVSAAIAAASGGLATLLVTPLLGAPEAAFASSLITKVVGTAFHTHLGPTQRDPSDLAESYITEIEHQQEAGLAQLATSWTSTYELLHSAPTFALEALASRIAELASTNAGTSLVLRQLLVGWTNFLARANHGAMHWDPWEAGGSRGAIKLQGARDPWSEPAATRSDPTTANVDPKAMGWALERTQRPMMQEHYGILEIFLDTAGRFLNIPDYGMRLDNVGPNVRKELREMGKVRDLSVNKIVRMCSYRHDGIEVDPPTPIASVLITADGYVRAHDWARFMKVRVESSQRREPWDVKGDFGRCMDQLIEGRETNSCQIDHASENAEIAAFAEHAQSLPLSLLKV